MGLKPSVVHSTMLGISLTILCHERKNYQAFTSIRLSNDKKYIVGETYQVYEKKTKTWIHRGAAILKSKKSFHADKINDFIAYLDTGYSAAETIKILRRMYKQENPKIDFLLFVNQ